VRASSSRVPPSIPSALVPALLAWYRTHRRALPWRADRDPYRVWVAEVLLQQTRVTLAATYFERFVREFPTVESLARAPRSRVLKLWQGAGYYGRAHHLHAAAREIVHQRGGRFPSTVPELEGLSGIGPYIARAVASIAFGRPHVALEANGLRVAARWTREEGDLRIASVRGRLADALSAVLPRTHAGEFNEAIMELGETVCRPGRPDCANCPVAFACRARRELADPGSVPRRRGPRSRPHVRAAVVVLEREGRWLVQQRPSSGLLPGLWEFPGGRIKAGELPEEAARRELAEETGIRVRALSPLGTVRHAYSHFTVELHAFRAGAPERTEGTPGTARRWVTPSELLRFPIPKATEKVITLLGAPDTASPGSRSRRGRTRASRPRGARSPPLRAPPKGTRA